MLTPWLVMAILMFALPANASEAVARRLEHILNTPGSDKPYFGAKITFSARNAEVPDIFRLVGEQAGLNVIWDDDVEGQKVSLDVKEVPWDQLLDIVVQQRGYKVQFSGNVVRIQTREGYAKSQRSVE